MAIKFFACSIWKKVEIANKSFFIIFQTALIIKIFEINYPAIRHDVL